MNIVNDKVYRIVRFGGMLIVLFMSAPALAFQSSIDHRPSSITRVLPGADALIRRGLSTLDGKRVGIVCNQTSVTRNGTHLVDTLISLRVKVVALFGPEHGIRGAAAAGATVNDTADSKTGLPIRSLYGKTRKPTPAMLRDIDVLVFDLQDVGARYYTYAATMAYCMEACAEQQKTFVLLDRPNPINGVDIEGPVIDSTLRSFVGFFPVPIRHGMTLGELAGMALGEHWIATPKPLDFKLVRMEGWERTMWYDQTGLPWIPPSPNIAGIAAATVYPGTCLLEATNISEGRGTPKPFEYFGAPWINGKLLADSLNALRLKGVKFEAIQFVPEASPAAPTPKYRDTSCQGIGIAVKDRDMFRPVWTALQVIATVNRLFPGRVTENASNFKRLFGVKNFSVAGTAGPVDLERFDVWCRDGIDRFRGMRGKYLVY